jgi:predicted acylesterase/phospholipase RssA/tetratricopeptide (TPR) repeat protein
MADKLEYGQLSALGLCIRTAELKAPPAPMIPLLHIGEYLPFYMRREQDDLAERHLADSGVLIVGRPLSGKTRMALQAAAAVVPDGLLLRVSGPERLLNLGALDVPYIDVGGKQVRPVLVLFFDEIARFDHASVDDLIERLAPQVEKLYVVATCNTGNVQRVFASASLRHLTTGLLSMRHMVEIPPLTLLQAAQIEKEVWKIHPGRDLGLDRTEIGVILLGAWAVRPSYASLPVEAKRILRSLFLCEQVTSPCPSDLLRTMDGRLAETDAVGSFERTLANLIETDIVHRDESLRLSIVSQEHKESIYSEHYQVVAVLKNDLSMLSNALEAHRDWAQLTSLGVYFADRLGDLGEARRVLERSLGIARHVDTLVALSLILARDGAKEAADGALEESLKALVEPDRQANQLIRFGDELYVRHDRARAVHHYQRARALAELPATVLAATFRAADTQLFGGEPELAESIYRALIEQASDASKALAEARLIVSLVAQHHFGEAAREAHMQLDRRKGDERQSFAMSMLESGENLFVDDRLGELRRIAWEAFRDTNAELARTDDFLGFADNLLTLGYLSAAKLIYRELGHEDALREDSSQHVRLLNNLATCHLYLRELGEARPLFDQALEILNKQKSAKPYVIAASEDGLVVCDIYERKFASAKIRCDALLKLGEDAENETVKVWARVCMGEIAWLQGDTRAAAEQFFALRALPNSLETLARADLGLARVNLHLRRLDNADVHVARGLATCVRRDYAWLRTEFETLRGELSALRSALNMGLIARQPARVIPLDALIMKGGGVKALAFTGAIRELEAYYGFNSFVGTSAGSIAAALMAAGASGAELQAMLYEKPFSDFLDCPWWQYPFTPFLGGVHPGVRFTKWMQERINRYVVEAPAVALKSLPKRAVIYASAVDRGPIVFDSHGEWSAASAFHAVRCSMSIPLFFRPWLHNSEPTYDGGLLNNYPVEIFLEQEGNNGRKPSFLALYLGQVRPNPWAKRSVFGDILSIWLDRNDAQIVQRYQNDTIVIDTTPVGTIDFAMTDEEKDFLVLAGRAAAVRHLEARGHLDPAQVGMAQQMTTEVEMMRMRIIASRRWRRLVRTAICVGALALLAWWSLTE